MLARCPDADLAVAIAAAHAGTEPPPVRPDPVRDARPEEPVSPVENLDVLVETLLHVVDGKVHYTSTAERALDGLAALHAARPHDFALLVGPLVVRVNEIFAAESPPWGRHYSTDFCHLIAQWIQPERPIAEPITVDSPRAWLIARLREVAVAIQAGTSIRLLALPTDETDWIDPTVVAERVLAVGDEALGRPHDVAIALARLAPWGRPAARKRLADATGTLAAVVRAACDGEEVVDEAPELVRRMLHWQITRPAAGAPYLYGDAPPPPPEPTEYPRDIYGQATVRPMPDGGLYFDVSHVPQWQAFERWRQHKQHSRYAPAWGVSQWPGASEWIWLDPWLGRQRIRRLVNPDLPLNGGRPGGGQAARCARGCRDPGDRRERLTSAVLGLALAAGFAGPTCGAATVHSGLDGAGAQDHGGPGPWSQPWQPGRRCRPGRCAACWNSSTRRSRPTASAWRRTRPGPRWRCSGPGAAPRPGPDHARPRPSRRRPVDAGGGPGRARRAGPVGSSARSRLQP